MFNFPCALEWWQLFCSFVGFLFDLQFTYRQKVLCVYVHLFVCLFNTEYAKFAGHVWRSLINVRHRDLISPDNLFSERKSRKMSGEGLEVRRTKRILLSPVVDGVSIDSKNKASNPLGHLIPIHFSVEMRPACPQTTPKGIQFLNGTILHLFQSQTSHPVKCFHPEKPLSYRVVNVPYFITQSLCGGVLCATNTCTGLGYCKLFTIEVIMI